MLFPKNFMDGYYQTVHKIPDSLVKTVWKFSFVDGFYKIVYKFIDGFY
jgi:hypothetical protein